MNKTNECTYYIRCWFLHKAYLMHDMEHIKVKIFFGYDSLLRHSVFTYGQDVTFEQT